MGSGCNNRTNRPATSVPDTGVKYTGPDIPSLDVCTGDYLDEIEAIILNKLVEFASGEGITIEGIDFDQCDFLQSFVVCCAQDKSLLAILNGMLKSLCTLNDDITEVSTSVTNIQTTLNYTIVPGCLSVTNTKIDTVLNKLIFEYCAFVQKVTAIFGGDLDNPVLGDDIINQIFDSVVTRVFNNISGCSPNDVVKTGTGVNTQIEIRGTCPIGSFMFGNWPISYFDTDGLGKEEYGLCGWAIMNGQNGIDARGFTFAMATNIPSPVALNSIVDPVFNSDADIDTTIGSIKGKTKHKLAGNESGIGSHIHTITDPGHTHRDGAFDRLMTMDGSYTLADSDSNNNTGSEPRLNMSKLIPFATTGITINANEAQAASVAHENRQPTLYVNCIQRVS